MKEVERRVERKIRIIFNDRGKKRKKDSKRRDDRRNSKSYDRKEGVDAMTEEKE